MQFVVLTDWLLIDLSIDLSNSNSNSNREQNARTEHSSKSP